MEAANVVLLPGLMLFIVKGQVSLWTLAVFVPVCLLLVIGAMYWRIKLHQIQGHTENYRPTMRLIRNLQWPSLVLTLVGVALCILLWVRPELSRGRSDQYVILFMATLSVLEYINYYHRQLNYFDNKADLKRVFSGKGFQPSQMRRDLDQIARGKS